MDGINIEELIVKLGKRICDLRKEFDMTQLDLAVKSNIDERQIQRLENGHTSPTLKTLLKLANGFGITLSKLLEFEK